MSTPSPTRTQPTPRLVDGMRVHIVSRGRATIEGHMRDDGPEGLRVHPSRGLGPFTLWAAPLHGLTVIPAPPLPDYVTDLGGSER